jgi:hypothetical protein
MRKNIEDAQMTEKRAELIYHHSKEASKAVAIKYAMREKDIRCTLISLRSAESVDLAFILDCNCTHLRWMDTLPLLRTLSMLLWTVLNLESTNCSANLRLAIVGYPDIRDTKRFEVLDFGSSVEMFKNFLSKLEATSGADTPEDLAGAIAIQQANHLSWSQPTRMVFVIADAPCHGTEFHNYEDSYPMGSPGIDIISELDSLQQKVGDNESMSFTFGRITKKTDEMIQRFLDCGINIEQVGIEDASS